MDREWGWQWVFPASSHSTDPRTGVRHRHHLHESVTAHPAAGRAISNPRLAPATSFATGYPDTPGSAAAPWAARMPALMAASTLYSPSPTSNTHPTHHSYPKPP